MKRPVYEAARRATIRRIAGNLLSVSDVLKSPMHGMIGEVHVERLADRALGSPGDSFVMVQWTAEVGTHWIAPLHVHHRDDEAWYVLSGALGFRLGDQELKASAGSAVLARRGTPHTYWNAGETEAEYLLVMSPRLAQLIDRIHEPNADVPGLFAQYDSAILESP